VRPESTLVTASIYFLIRLSPSFVCWLNVALLFVSVLTVLIAGLGANWEQDSSGGGRLIRLWGKKRVTVCAKPMRV
jgi:hypothetical protein